MSNDPRILPGCTVLPPMEPATLSAGRTTGTSKAKGKAVGQRFKVLNTFIDFTMGSLSRGEALVWLVLYRDTKADGTATTSVADLARRIGAYPSTVKRAVKALHGAGLLTLIYRGSLRHGPSKYRVHPLRRQDMHPAADGQPLGRTDAPLSGRI
jgi:hypothetical protein